MNHAVGQGLPRECPHYCCKTTRIQNCLSENRNNMKSGGCSQQKYLSIVRETFKPANVEAVRADY